ncbi:MAG: hypothetical protein AB1696_29010 [Planctomycetota bacterium]
MFKNYRVFLALMVLMPAMLSMGCASSRTFDIKRWDKEGVCVAVTESLIEGNYRVEAREIYTPPVEEDFRAKLMGVRHETLNDTRCFVKVRPEEKLGRYRVDVYVDEQNPCLLGIRQRSEIKEEKFLDELEERLAKMTIRSQVKPY